MYGIITVCSFVIVRSCIGSLFKFISVITEKRVNFVFMSSDILLPKKSSISLPFGVME